MAAVHKSRKSRRYVEVHRQGTTRQDGVEDMFPGFGEKDEDEKKKSKRRRERKEKERARKKYPFSTY